MLDISNFKKRSDQVIKHDASEELIFNLEKDDIHEERKENKV